MPGATDQPDPKKGNGLQSIRNKIVSPLKQWILSKKHAFHVSTTPFQTILQKKKPQRKDKSMQKRMQYNCDFYHHVDV